MYQSIGINTVWWRCSQCKRLVKRIEWRKDYPVCLACWDEEVQ